MAVGISVSYIRTGICPLDKITFASHQFNKLIFIYGILHTFIDLNSERHFPTLTFHGCTILSLLDAGALISSRRTD